MSLNKTSVKAVTFDLWETLLLEKDGDNSRRILARCKNLEKILDKFGVKISVMQLDQTLKAMSSWLVSVWETNKDVTHLDQIRFIIKTALKKSVKMKKELIKELSSAYVSPLFEVPPYLNPDAPKVLQWLKERNTLIGLICNTGRTPGFSLRKFLNNAGVADYFDVMFFSDEVGIRKPDPQIFQMAAKKLKVKPCEIIHVGDNLKSDIWGAKNAGLKTIYFSTETGRDMTA
ncbi:HAD family hydrolase, partial [Candidatus Bathyarchaeota archaeon]|nr:HAD family hydrolase [Candidatus Bathyarchaeota archaeon]